MRGDRIPDEVLEASVEAYYATAGNVSEAARNLGISRRKLQHHLGYAESRLGFVKRPVADGQIDQRKAVERPLPAPRHVQRYLLTSAQNNTHVHPSLGNLIALRDWYDNLDNSSCELLVGTYSYQTATYGPKSVKRGSYRGAVASEDLWYAQEVMPYIQDTRIRLAPGLVWCGELNIMPTAKHPLTGMEDYNARDSNIVPHAKISMESVAAMPDEPAKLNFSTGTVTMRNYVQKRAGILAEQNHHYGALLVEVDSAGSWWCRQIHVAADGSIMDIGPHGSAGVRALEGSVQEHRVAAAITWGDAHVSEMDPWVRETCWGTGGMLDQLDSPIQVLHDIYSMRSRSHHEVKDFHKRYVKRGKPEDSVEKEVEITARFLAEATRDGAVETVVVCSNHDRHLGRWLNEADFRQDLANAKYFCHLQCELLGLLDEGRPGQDILELALREKEDIPNVRFLAIDESCIIEGIENGLHGDLGPNGSRGSTKGLTKLGRPVNKGHDHTAAIRGGVYSAGACSARFSYMSGPHSHSISHIVTLRNGTRQIITMWDGKFRAETRACEKAPKKQGVSVSLKFPYVGP